MNFTEISGHGLRTLAAAVFICAFTALTGCRETAENRHTQSSPIKVKAETVSVTDKIDTYGYIGTVQARKSAVLSSPYPGTLVSLNVSQGDHVKKGDIIAGIESQSVISSREMALATLAQAEDGYRRLSEVHGSGGVADVRMVEIRTQLEKAKAAAAAAEKAYEDCKIKAPYDGVIGDILIDEGIEASISQPIARILDISSVEIRFPVPENEISGIRTGEKATVEIPALGYVEIRASVSEKGMAASPLSHSYDCILSPEIPYRDLLPGMVCKVYLDSRAESGIVIPASAVKTGAGGRYVWAVEDGKAVRKNVTVKGFSGDGIIISEGLGEGDTVITEGSRKVSSGMPVTVGQL